MDLKTHISSNNHLQHPVTPITSMGAHTAADNILPAPPATAARTHPGQHGASPTFAAGHVGRAKY